MNERLPNFHPGETLREDYLEPLGLTPREVATAMGLQVEHVAEILEGRGCITADTALRLAKVFSSDARFWLNLQAQYDLKTAQTKTDLSGVTVLYVPEPLSG